MPSQWAFEGGALTEVARLPDRAQLYGDALFETMLWTGYNLALKTYHLTRLLYGCERLDIGLVPSEAKKHFEELERALARSHLGHSLAVRLSCTPIAESRGYVRSSQSGAALSSTITPFETREGSRVHLGISGVQLACQPVIAGIKHANRLEQVLAASELARAGYEDGLMLNTDGVLVCTTRANIYCLIDEVWHTPVIDRSGVAGTRRAWLFDSALGLGLSLKESELTLTSLERANAVMISNALRGFVSVEAIAGRPYQHHEGTDFISYAYQAYLSRES